MNVLIVNDVSWDNFALISTKLTPRCINPNHRLNYFYGKHLQYISNICTQNMMHLLRLPFLQYNEKKCIENSLKNVKFCIIFHNFIEYNTISSLYINICNENKIPYFIFSEHCGKFYMNGEYIHNTKFKTCVRELEYIERKLSIEIPDTIIFDTIKKCPENINEIVTNLRSRYQNLKDEKLFMTKRL